jgi:hypothetical protein
MKVVLSIAGSDSGGGAGIQADIKSALYHEVFMTTAITAVTAQNTKGVQDICVLEADFVKTQILSVLSDFEVNTIKIGMLGSKNLVLKVKEVIEKLNIPIILDPVAISRAGSKLITDEAIESLKELLNYSATQKLPNSLVTRIQDLRNGTIMQKGVGRVIKSKDGYTYQTILNTFLTLSDKIRWAFDNKDFTSESNKISYMMAIIDSNINDLVVKENTINNRNNIKSKNNLINDEKDNRTRKKIEYIPQSKGIAKFLDEDDF